MSAKESKDVMVTLTASQFTLPVEPDAGWQPAGAPPRMIWGYNGQLPGPTIRAKEGDTLVVRVKNDLDQPTSVHWHGMHQKGTWFMDGVEMISQPRISPGQCFEYRFRAEPAGTHWYHSHTGVQYSEGLFGALIVDARDDPYQDRYQQEFVVLMNDWFHRPANEILKTLETVGYADTGAPDVADVPFETALINGKGRSLEASAQGPVEVFQIEAGVRTVRLRLINASSTYAFEFVIDDHAMEIIAADGSPAFLTTGAGRTRRLVLHIGERYDVLVDVPATRNSYWIRARTLETDKDGNNRNHGVKAILRDAGAPQTDPRVDSPLTDPAISYFDLSSPRAVLPPLAGEYETRELTLEGSMLKVDPDTKTVLQPYAWKVNNQVFAVPEKPIITPDLELIRPKDPPTTQISIPISEGFSLVILNKTGMNHPFHLHGHSFQLLAWGTPADSLAALKKLPNPILKDTVMVPRKGGVQIYFTPDNPGYWFFHCHIEWHLATGMAILIHEGDPKSPRPNANYGVCGG